LKQTLQPVVEPTGLDAYGASDEFTRSKEKLIRPATEIVTDGFNSVCGLAGRNRRNRGDVPTCAGGRSPSCGSS